MTNVTEEWMREYVALRDERDAYRKSLQLIAEDREEDVPNFCQDVATAVLEKFKNE